MPEPGRPGRYPGEVVVVDGKAWVWSDSSWSDQITKTPPPLQRNRPNERR
jgi:hypothetical protein